MRHIFAILIGVALLPTFAFAQNDALHFQPAAASSTALPGDTSETQLDLNPFDNGEGRGWLTKQFYVSGTVGDANGPIITAHAGAGYEFIEDVTINLELLAGGVINDRSDEAGAVFGLDALFRWNFLHGDGWKVYVDVGAGFQLATTDYPSDSFWAFRLMSGPGATVKIADNIDLMTGVRYIHISNSNTTKVNNGLNAAQFYMGVMIPF